MKRQIEMENSLLLAHREFITNLEKSLDILEKEINEAAEMTDICTSEWCEATENVVDELHKFIYAISEPTFSTVEDSQRLRHLRRRIRNIYAQYKTISA